MTEQEKLAREKVRNEIADIVHMAGCDYKLPVPRGSKVKRKVVERTIDYLWADQILRVLVVLHPDQELPKYLYEDLHGFGYDWQQIVARVQQDMLKVGWLRTLKKKT